MKNLNKHIGSFGEKVAVEYLQSKGYKILAKNFCCIYGEVDIIAKQKNSLIFIEVKTRQSNLFGMPSEAVTKVKQQKICRVAAFFIQKNKLFDLATRFDIIEVDSSDNAVNHIEDAFYSCIRF